MYSHTTSVTHYLLDFLSQVDNIHGELNNQEIGGVLCGFKEKGACPLFSGFFSSG